jgi:DNA polymerase
MSISSRNAVFLDEMGIGALWKLRNPGVAFDPVASDEAGLAPAEAIVAEAATEPVAHAAVSTMQEPPPAPVPASAPAPAPAPAPVIEHAPAPAPAIERAPAPLPPPVPASAPVVASDDESTAWFDDVPATVPAAPPRAARRPGEPVSDEAIAAMDWPALQDAVSNCTRCPLAATRLHAVNGRGPQQAAWLAIAAAPSAEDDAEARAITGEAGQLLGNMFKAIALKPEADVYVTNLVKCRPATDDGANRNPTADELIACRPYLERELALTGANMAMTFGQFAAKGLMMGPAARGKVMHYGDASLPVVATYHPDDLLRRPEDKAKAWGDLCLARTARD